MNNNDKEKMINAVKTLKDICTKSSCNDCPLFCDCYGICVVQAFDSPPEFWELIDMRGK